MLIRRNPKKSKIPNPHPSQESKTANPTVLTYTWAHPTRERRPQVPFAVCFLIFLRPVGQLDRHPEFDPRRPLAAQTRRIAPPRRPFPLPLYKSRHPHLTAPSRRPRFPILFDSSLLALLLPPAKGEREKGGEERSLARSRSFWISR